MLNNPYFCYPGFPCAGMFNLELSNSELIKLHRYILSLMDTINKKSFLNLCIGTGAEEYFVETHNDIQFQWQQLFPEHLQTRAKQDPSFPIVNIIITPSSFMTRDYTPAFIRHAPEFNWYSEERNTYRSHSHNIVVKIFNCPMPSKFDYEPVLERIKSAGIITDEEFFRIYDQTEQDKSFINRFYRDLGLLFNIVNGHWGYVTCLSSAVFNSDTSKSKFKDFYLFKEIINLFPLNHMSSNRLLAEWIYRPLCYTMNIYNHVGDNRCFSYCSIDSLRPYIGRDANIPLLDLRGNLAVQEIVVRGHHKAETIDKKDKKDTDCKDDNNIYNCIFNKCCLKNLTIEELRKQVVREITNNNKEDDIINYIFENSYLEKIKNKIDNNKYEICNYYLKLISTGKSEVKDYFGISNKSSFFDSLEIKYISKITNIGIIVKDTEGNVLYCSDGIYNQNIVLMYDLEKMTYEHEPQY